MRKMSWIRSSRAATLVVLFALALAAVGSAGALTIDDQTAFNESQVGESVSSTVVLEDPFQGDDVSETWTLNASTGLENVRWTVTVLDQGNQLNETVYGDQGFQQELSLDNGGDEVRIEVTGDTPAIENYTYDPPETYELYDFNAISGNSEADLNESQIHHYTNDSKDARNAIDEAAVAVENSSSSDAPSTLNSSISSYDNGNFGNAIDLAERAQDEADQAEQSEQRTQTLIYAAIAVVVLALAAGTVYYWRQQQDDYGKLQ